MSLISENIIPGQQGKIFGTDAIEKKELECIKKRILSLDGIKKVEINMEVFPREIKVYTSKLVSIEDLEKRVMTTGFHAIPKDSIEF
ncbi:heavy-metal-associated domain-containing protein [uncultured Winogradskyella sp.]|uniref:heavy-metal-associated domain-containing protein n=1 Tax=uncultured Winogradskyella sp. TaxID=395353 RepID=UPI0026326F96|nr:heavy-metal-associated domain-containing protein [uncultured Winogradskyella sp.]